MSSVQNVLELDYIQVLGFSIMFLHMKLILLGLDFASRQCHIQEARVRPAWTIQSYLCSVAVT